MTYNPREIRQLNDGLKQHSDAQKAQRAKQFLAENMTKKLQTSYIFALAEIERTFGYLWGYNTIDKSQLTQNQLEFLELYKNLRKAIFDNGNNQLRMLMNDLTQYDVNFIGQYFINEGRKE